MNWVNTGSKNCAAIVLTYGNSIFNFAKILGGPVRFFKISCLNMVYGDCILVFRRRNMSLVFSNRIWEHPLLGSEVRHIPRWGELTGGPYTIFGETGQVAYHWIELLEMRKMMLYLPRYLALLQNGKGSKFKFSLNF